MLTILLKPAKIADTGLSFHLLNYANQLSRGSHLLCINTLHSKQHSILLISLVAVSLLQLLPTPFLSQQLHYSELNLGTVTWAVLRIGNIIINNKALKLKLLQSVCISLQFS